MQQIGFRRTKRGYNKLRLGPEDLSLSNEPTDPYFPYQWYLVSAVLCHHISLSTSLVLNANNLTVMKLG